MSERLEEIIKTGGNCYDNVNGYTTTSLTPEDISWLIEQAELAEHMKMKYENTGSTFGRQNQALLIEENNRLRGRVEELEKKQEYYETHLNEPYIKSLQEDSSKYRKIIALYHKGNDYQIIDFLRDLKRIITGKEFDGEKL